MSESAVSDKLLLVYGLARNRRNPTRPSEPGWGGVHPEEGVVGPRWRSLPREVNSRGWSRAGDTASGIAKQHTGDTHGNSQRSTRGNARLTDS